MTTKPSNASIYFTETREFYQSIRVSLSQSKFILKEGKPTLVAMLIVWSAFIGSTKMYVISWIVRFSFPATGTANRKNPNRCIHPVLTLELHRNGDTAHVLKSSTKCEIIWTAEHWGIDYENMQMLNSGIIQTSPQTSPHKALE